MQVNRQVTLFEQEHEVLEIKKHSSLVQMNNVTNLQQRKAINSLIWIAKDQLKRDPEKRVFSVEIGTIKKLSGIGRNDNKELKASLKALLSLIIEYNILGKDKHERGAFPFLSFVKIEGQRRGGTSTLHFEFPTPILEAVKRPAMYVKLNLFIRRGLSSKHSLALYEILKDYQNIGNIRIEIENFRRLVGVSEGQYKIFTMLQKRIIDVAVEEINEKTDLKAMYDLEREGRKITAIIFRVHATIKEETKTSTNEEIISKLKGLGIREATARELLEKHDEDYVLANIRIVEEELAGGKTIRNVPAYLMKAFEVDFRPLETEQDRIKKLKTEEKFQASKRAALEQEQRKGLLKRFEQEKMQAVSTVLNDLKPAEIKALKAEFLTGIQANPLFKKMLDSKGFEAAIIQSHRHKFIAEKYLSKTAYSFDEFVQNEGLDAKGEEI